MIWTYYFLFNYKIVPITFVSSYTYYTENDCVQFKRVNYKGPEYIYTAFLYVGDESINITVFQSIRENIYYFYCNIRILQTTLNCVKWQAWLECNNFWTLYNNRKLYANEWCSIVELCTRDSHAKICGLIETCSKYCLFKPRNRV